MAEQMKKTSLCLHIYLTNPSRNTSYIVFTLCSFYVYFPLMDNFIVYLLIWREVKNIPPAYVPVFLPCVS